MSRELTLVVMAAGSSSRYGRLKQTVRVGPNEQTLIEYGLFDALRAGFSHFVFVVRRAIQSEFHEAVGSRLAAHAHVSYVLQDMPSDNVVAREKPWGTGHAILVAAEALSGSFGVINADDFYGYESFTILGQALQDDLASTVVGFTLDHTLSDHGPVTRGICRTDTSGRLVDITETFKIERRGVRIRSWADEHDSSPRDLTGNELVSMNMWGLQRATVDEFRSEWQAFYAEHSRSPTAEFYLPAAVTNMIRCRGVGVDVKATPETWFGLTNPGDERVVERALNQLTEDGTYPRSLWT